MMGSSHERDRIYLKNPVLLQNLQSIYGLPMRYIGEACNSGWNRLAAGYGKDVTIAMAGKIHKRALLNQTALWRGSPCAALRRSSG